MSQLTNENLKLKDENQELQAKLESHIELNQPETQEAGQRIVEEEIKAKVELALEQKNEEVEQAMEQNAELVKKLQALTNEFAVMKSDAEIVK